MADDNTVYSTQRVRRNGEWVETVPSAVEWATIRSVPVKDISSVGDAVSLAQLAGVGEIVTGNALALWDGRYDDTSSHLAYCDKGRFGSASTKEASEFATSTHTHTIDTIAEGNSPLPERMGGTGQSELSKVKVGFADRCGVFDENGNPRMTDGVQDTQDIGVVIAQLLHRIEILESRVQ